jgi:allantoinase
MTERRKGPDHKLYPHSPRPGRWGWEWPCGARLAFCVFLYFETWELDPPEGALHDPRHTALLGDQHPNYKTFAQFEHGNRVGVFRILNLLDRLELKATVAANSAACTKYPFLVDEFRRRGYEFAAHGSFATRMISSRMSEAEQRAEIAQSIAAVGAAAGQKPRGWISQDYGESTVTPRLLAEAGLAYVADWANDDQPYAMLTNPPLLSIPNQAEWDDVQLMWHRRIRPSVWQDGVCEAFDVLHAEGGGFFGLHVHPWLTGMPHRIGHLEAAMDRMMAAPGLWRTTAGDVADHMRAALRSE